MPLNHHHYQSMKLKRGAVREDGFVFWCYTKNCQGGEWWMSPSQFTECDSRAKASQRIRKAALDDKLKSGSRFKRGDRNQQGDIFWGYNSSAKNGEVWLSEEKFRVKLEKKAVLNKSWTDRNPEKMERLKRDWDRSNPEKVRIYQTQQRHRRRARKRANGGISTRAELISLRKSAKGRCFYCRKKGKLGYDHVGFLIRRARPWKCIRPAFAEIVALPRPDVSPVVIRARCHFVKCLIITQRGIQRQRQLADVRLWISINEVAVGKVIDHGVSFFFKSSRRSLWVWTVRMEAIFQ